MMNKKGQVEPLLLMLMNPWVLLGIGIFVLALVLLSFFMLGKVIGAVLMLAGAIGIFMQRIPWYMGVLLLVAGIFMLWNPGDIMALNMVPFR